MRRKGSHHVKEKALGRKSKKRYIKCYTSDTFTRSYFYILFTHKCFYTQTLLHTDAFSHTDAFTHRCFYTQTLYIHDAVTQTLLHTGSFTHRCFHIQTLLHSDAFTHRRFYTQTLSHTYNRRIMLGNPLRNYSKLHQPQHNNTLFYLRF